MLISCSLLGKSTILGPLLHFFFFLHLVPYDVSKPGVSAGSSERVRPVTARVDYLVHASMFRVKEKRIQRMNYAGGKRLTTSMYSDQSLQRLMRC